MAKDPICGMSVEESKGLRLTNNGRTYYFCSDYCLQKFVQMHKISQETLAACSMQPKTKWYKNKTLIVFSIIVLLVLCSHIVPVLEPFGRYVVMYLRKIWWAVLLGLILGGLIDYYIPHEYISHLLAKPEKRTILYSVTLGFFMSLCSHGILALSIELHKKGASNAAVVAFLLASPWANFPITIMLIGFFGLKALYIIFCALLIAIITGFVFQFLEEKKLVERNPNTIKLDEAYSISKDLKERFKTYDFSPAMLLKDIKGIISGSISLANMVLWWLLVGMGLASLTAAYIPAHIFHAYMGPTVLGLGVTLALATILEVCSEGTAPLAFEIYRQTGSLGNPFVFLMAGVVTDYTEIGLLWHNVGRRVAILLPIITVPQVIALGILANMIFK